MAFREQMLGRYKNIRDDMANPVKVAHPLLAALPILKAVGTSMLGGAAATAGSALAQKGIDKLNQPKPVTPAPEIQATPETPKLARYKSALAGPGQSAPPGKPINRIKFYEAPPEPPEQPPYDDGWRGGNFNFGGLPWWTSLAAAGAGGVLGGLGGAQKDIDSYGRRFPAPLSSAGMGMLQGAGSMGGMAGGYQLHNYLSSKYQPSMGLGLASLVGLPLGGAALGTAAGSLLGRAMLKSKKVPEKEGSVARLIGEGMLSGGASVGGAFLAQKVLEKTQRNPSMQPMQMEQSTLPSESNHDPEPSPEKLEPLHHSLGKSAETVAPPKNFPMVLSKPSVQQLHPTAQGKPPAIDAEWSIAKPKIDTSTISSSPKLLPKGESSPGGGTNWKSLGMLGLGLGAGLGGTYLGYKALQGLGGMIPTPNRVERAMGRRRVEGINDVTRGENQDFLRKSHALELARQEAMLEGTRSPHLFGPSQ